MLEVCEKSHIATVINSLDKIYRQSKVNGELNPLDIYYIDIIYKLLYQCNIDISNEDRKQLINIYNNLSFKSDYICPNTNITPFHLNIKTVTIQNNIDDCDESPIKENKIYYWQEESLETTYQDIVPLVNQEYLDSKYNDTYSNFENGKNIDYTNVGRICFADNKNIEYANYEITDILGNDMSNFFTLTMIPSQTCNLIVSKNIYSFGEVFIKIKKTNNNTPIIVQGIFEEQFENQFE